MLSPLPTLLRRALLVVIAVVSLCFAPAVQAAVRKDPPTSIHGAVYVPSNAYNAPQLWKNFSVKETRRDFRFARTVHVNALRVWASYEFWKSAPEKFQTEFDQMLSAAHENGIRVLISLFENDGVPPTEDNMWTTDPKKAFAIQSPGRDIATGDKALWEPPREFVTWFMKRYSSDDRVLAIEVMNEPNVDRNGQPGTVPFAQSMFSTAKSLQGTVPLTLGSARIEVAELFIPLGLDVIQYHDNFPRDPAELITFTKAALALGDKSGLPVWLTEWQRTRSSATGFGNEKISDQERTSDYVTLAGTVRQYPVGSFFWCLMAKRAYLRSQRLNGTVNGLFWPDGSVTSLQDARAIANDPKLNLRETPFPAHWGEDGME